jgi:hypothetical protein
MKMILSSRKHHYLVIVSTFLITLALIAGTVSCSCSDSDVDGDVVVIKTWSDLDKVRQDMEGNYILMENLNDTMDEYGELVGKTANGGKGWQPIGNATDPFKGTFDGNGKTISGLFICRPDENEVGLFGYILEPAVIENVGLLSVNVTGNESVGAVVGYSWKGTVQSDIGPTDSKTYSSGNVTGEQRVGGLVGWSYDGTVYQCESKALVFHESSVAGEEHRQAGGLVGLNSGNVSHCDYYGVVTGDREVGGLVGYNSGLPQGLVEFCGGKYSVNGVWSVGGIAGENWGDAHWVIFTGTVKGEPKTEYLIALDEDGIGNGYSSDTALPGSYVGGVVGFNGGTLEDSSADATVEGYQYVGGVVGGNNGTMDKCTSDGSVTGEDFVGGLVGYNGKEGTWSDCHSDAHVEGTGPHVDPQVGLDEAAVHNLYMAVAPVGTGTVTDMSGASSHVAGASVSIKAVPAAGYEFFTWTAPAGTFANANAADTTFTMPAQDVTVTANFAPLENLGIWDWYDLDAIRNNLGDSYVLMNNLDSTTAGYGELASMTANGGKGWHPIGIFTGSFDGQGYEIRDLFIDRPGVSTVGLFVNVGGGGVIQNVGVVNADITADSWVGGLVGWNEGTVSNSYSTGSVNGLACVGGLVGINFDIVSNSYSMGSVTGNAHAGGLVGLNKGTVSSSYSTGSVTGGEYVGGLVGGNDGMVSNSYSIGSVAGDADVGGLVGLNEGSVSNSFWDTQTSGQATSVGGTGKTTAEMKDITTFSGAAWNIIAVANVDTRNTQYIWNIVDGQTYPFLSWES